MVKVNIIGNGEELCCHLLILTTIRLQMKNKFTCAFSSSVCAKYSSAILSAQTLQCSRGRAGLETSAHLISILQVEVQDSRNLLLARPPAEDSLNLRPLWGQLSPLVESCL